MINYITQVAKARRIEFLTKITMAKEKPIKMHFPPTYVRDYVNKYVAGVQKESNNVAEKALWEDIGTMVEVACKAMVQINPQNKS